MEPGKWKLHTMDLRLSKLKTLLSKHSLDAALISSVPNIIYLTQFTHFNEFEREAFLLITKRNQYIFTDARYTHAVKQHTPTHTFTLKEIGHQKSFTDLLQEIRIEEGIKTLGIETHNLTVSEYQRISKIFPSSSLPTTPYPLTTNFKPFDLTELRLLKDDDEIKNIQQACQLGDQTFEYILTKIKNNITEKELVFEMEWFMRKQGATPSFDTIVAFEENAAIPHHKSNNQRLKPHDVILLDFGIKYENYCSDMTRTIFFGTPSPEKQRVYQAVKASQQAAIDYIKNQLTRHSREHLKKGDTTEWEVPVVKRRVNPAPHLAPLGSAADSAARLHLLGLGFQSIPHALGHGIGLQVHEAPTLSPNSKDILTNGMVFSIEPGIYLPDVFGVRIEDLFTIKNNQLIQLTHSLSTLK